MSSHNDSKTPMVSAVKRSINEDRYDENWLDALIYYSVPLALGHLSNDPYNSEEWDFIHMREWVSTRKSFKESMLRKLTTDGVMW